MKIDERLLAYKPISVTLNFDWENTTYDERVLARHNYIEEQKKKDPNYVGWDFPEHFRSTHGVTKISALKCDLTRLVNTIGQMVGHSRNSLVITFGRKNVEGYYTSYMGRGTKRIGVRVHRVVACTFIPIPERLKEFRNKLVVNHKDDLKYNNLRSNLEWCTQQENTIKGFETGVSKSTAFKMTVNLPGALYKKEYYFSRAGTLHKYGLTRTSVVKSIAKNIEYLHSYWEIVPIEETLDKIIGISNEELSILRDPKYGQSGTKAIIGTIVSEGPCKGEQFCLFGASEIVKYGFDTSTIWKVLRKFKITHRGCTFKSMNRYDVKEIPIGLTTEQVSHFELYRSNS